MPSKCPHILLVLSTGDQNCLSVDHLIRCAEKCILWKDACHFVHEVGALSVYVPEVPSAGNGLWSSWARNLVWRSLWKWGSRLWAGELFRQVEGWSPLTKWPLKLGFITRFLWQCLPSPFLPMLCYLCSRLTWAQAHPELKTLQSRGCSSAPRLIHLAEGLLLFSQTHPHMHLAVRLLKSELTSQELWSQAEVKVYFCLCSQVYNVIEVGFFFPFY